MAWLTKRLLPLLRRSRHVAATTQKSAFAIGLWGEQQAANWLCKNGYLILGQRVRPNRRDEIDIVARRGDMLVFVEVKTRHDEAFGRPAASVDRHKRHRLCRAAVTYLQKAGFPQLYYRFDVIEVLGSPGANAEIRHLEDAFRLAKRYKLPVRSV